MTGRAAAPAAAWAVARAAACVGVSAGACVGVPAAARAGVPAAVPAVGGGQAGETDRVGLPGFARRVVAPAVLAGLLVLASACGVPAEDRPRVVEVPPGPFPSPATAGSTAPTGRVTETLCFVRDDRLVPVPRRVDPAPDADAQLRDLLAGPITVERDAGLTSALPGAMSAVVADVAGATPG